MRARDLAVRPEPVQLPAARRRRGGPDDGRRRHATRCWCSASSRPTIPSRRRWSARWRSAPSTAAPAGAAREARAATRSARGASAFLGAPYAARPARRDGRAQRDVRDGDHLGALPALPRAREARGARGRCARPAASAGASSAASRTSTPTARRPTSRCSRRRGAARRSSSGRDQARRLGRAHRSRAATITHHHAVGRDHRPWYDRQRPEPFAAALRGAKAAVDPAGVMNPGVLLDPLPMKIAVLGPGGVGGLLAGGARPRGQRGDVVAQRVDGRGHRRARASRVSSVTFGELRRAPAGGDALEEPVDALIVATKAAGLEEALERDRGRARARAAAAERARPPRRAAAALRPGDGARRLDPRRGRPARARASSCTRARSCSSSMAGAPPSARGADARARARRSSDAGVPADGRSTPKPR